VSVAGFLALTADFGLAPYTLRLMSPARATGLLLGPIVALRMLFTLLAFVSVLALGAVVDVAPEALRIVEVVCAWFLLRGFAEGLAATFVARDAAHVAGLLEVIFRGAGALAAIAVVLAGGDLIAALALQIGVAAAQLLFTAVCLLRRLGGLGVSFAVAPLIGTARQAGPYALSRVVSQLTQRLAVPVIGALLSASAAGLYHAADRFVYVLSWIPHFAGIALLPTAVRRHAESDVGAGPLYQRALGGIVVAVVPASVGLFLVAPQAVELIFGDAFAAAVPVLRLLALLVFAHGLSRVMAIFLLAIDRVAARSRYEAWGMLANAALLLVLVPLLGVIGAALASLLTETLLIGLFARELAPVVGPPRCGRRLASAAMASAVFAGVLVAVGPLSLPASVALAVPLYAAGLALFPEIRRDAGQALRAWRHGA